MKRSKSLRLVLMGGAAISLAACDKPVDVGVFEDVEQCTVMGYSQSACESAIEQAKKEHARAAPKYASRGDCEAEFGKCEPASAPEQAQSQSQGQLAQQPAAGSFFMPLLAGYMMGRMMGGGYAAQPLYRPYSGPAAGTGLYTGAGSRVATGPGLTRVSETTFTNARAGTTTLARGGFGARAGQINVAS